MAASEGDTLENLLNKITNPSIIDDDRDIIMEFCDQVNKLLDGPQIAIRLLAYKIQSPQERESLLALSCLEATVRNCGSRFHQEIGKFRFLNEMIKLVSPKYSGSYTSDGVKKKVIELLYSWSKGLKQESKILEAYQMLKKQKIVTEDPNYIDDQIENMFPPISKEKERNSIFNDDAKSKQLQKLLSSKNTDDLQAANRLIKNMVKQDAERMEKISRRTTEIETVNNNIKLLNEMLNVFHDVNTAQSDREIMKELYDNLEKARPALFRLASETDEKDTESINRILTTNDEVGRVMTIFKQKISIETNSSVKVSTKNDPTSLLDMDISTDDSDLLQTQLNELGLNKKENLSKSQTTSLSTDNDDLLQLGNIFSSPNINQPPLSHQNSNSFNKFQNLNLPKYQHDGNTLTSSQSCENKKNDQFKISNNAFEDLDVLSRSKNEQSKFEQKALKSQSKTLAELATLKVQSVDTINNRNLLDDVALLSPSFDDKLKIEPLPLDDVSISINDINFETTAPLSIYDKNNIKIMVYSTNCNLKQRNDIFVYVITTLSTNVLPIKNYNFVAAVPKAMKVKLQPVSADSLAPFNPISPPTPITQIMLISNPNKEKMKCKFKVSYIYGENVISDSGDIESLSIS